jgi:ATP-binding cassette subfamily B protein
MGEAIEGAARHCGLVPRSLGPTRRPPAAVRGDTEAFVRWIESTASALGIEAEPNDTSYGDLEPRLLRSAPAIVRLGIDEDPKFAVIVGRSGMELLVLAPDLRVRRIATSVVIRRWCRAIETPVQPEIDRILAEGKVPASRLASARHAILREKLRPSRVEGLFVLRPPSGASLWQELRRAGVLRRLAVLLGAHLVQYTLFLLSWWVVGRAALEGRFDRGWFAGWALLLASLIPFRLLATWSQGSFAVAAGAILKGRLLMAALRLDPEIVRGQGMGEFVGRVIESEAVESLALSGGISALTAGIELTIAAIVLGLGPGGTPLALLLVAWTVCVFGIGWRCLRHRSAWTAARLGLTHDLIEKMVGHRTRLVQEARENAHVGEDGALERYLATSIRMDRATAQLTAIAPRGWLLLGVLGWALWIFKTGTPATALAAGLGGILLAYMATSRLAHGIAQLGGALIAWKQVEPMLRALSNDDAPEARGSALVAPSGDSEGSVRANGEPLKVLQARDLAFCHPSRSEPVLKGLCLEIFEGDRILLEGSSGCGKSTLASLLTGLRVPDGGTVLLRGVDRQTMGAEVWRRRVAAAPQFHENHVLTETLAFNLLMGRRWPPRAEDVKRAEELCGELGLTGLLARMPAGLYEIVGESGWQLSHGERSRLFMARALLQESDLVVLDESFAALDPVSLETSLRCALGRAKTLVVIAHP